MKIKLIKVKIKDLVSGYVNNDDEGVTALDGKLNIRPKYQREFIYDERKQKLVIDTVLKGFPLNTMYWVINKEGEYEILDGQQRTMSICEYRANHFHYKYNGKEKYYDNLSDDIKDKFNNYELMVYVCEGSDSERLEWFRTINIAGEPLTEQELRNANYTGSWLSSAKAKFSKKLNCPADNRFGNYLSGTPNRQDYLETALYWYVDFLKLKTIEEYMAKHQDDDNADDLWNYICDVFKWVESTFTVYRKEMKGLPWGIYYNKFHKMKFNITKLNKKCDELMLSDDDSIESKKGIYEYLLSGDEKPLHLRAFSSKDKRILFERQKGKCPDCGKTFKIDDLEAHHIKRYSDGGARDISNGVLLCRDCHDKRHRLDAKRGLNKKK